MYGYKITFDGHPETVWSCETTAKDYIRGNRYSENIIEVSIISGKNVVKNADNTEDVHKSIHALSCAVATKNTPPYIHPGTDISVTTIAVCFEKLNVISKELTSEDCTNQQCLLLPAFTEAISKNELDEINSLLHKYIHHNELESEYDKMICYSILYNVLAEIDAHMRKRLSQDKNKKYNYYVKKVDWLIQERYNTRLTETAIAKELGISSGYLSSMYKKSTGITISELILIYRMRKAAELLENGDMTTVKIAAAIGFDDEHYFRKKFKQYFGTNITEYKRNKLLNTLNHDKTDTNV